MKVPLASNGLRPKDIDAAKAVLDSGQLTMGKIVSNFEREFADYIGVENFVLTNSGSSANLAIIESLMRPSLGKPRLNP